MTIWSDGAGSAPPLLAAFTSSPFSSYDSYDDVAVLSSLVAGDPSPPLVEEPPDLTSICFVKGTRILLFNGLWCPIEKLMAGMLLADAHSPDDKYLTVKDVYITGTYALVHLPPIRFRGKLMQTLSLTPRHLIYDLRQKEWLEAMSYCRHIDRFQTPTEVFHVETTVWGACIAEGVPCETLALSSEAKQARMAANRTAGFDVPEEFF